MPLDKTPRALDLSPDGRRLYFTVAGLAAVRVLDTATGQVAAEIPVGASPHQAPVAADGRWALVPCPGTGRARRHRHRDQRGRGDGRRWARRRTG